MGDEPLLLNITLTIFLSERGAVGFASLFLGSSWLL
jgi:hypothetical protein